MPDYGGVIDAEEELSAFTSATRPSILHEWNHGPGVALARVHRPRFVLTRRNPTSIAPRPSTRWVVDDDADSTRDAIVDAVTRFARAEPTDYGYVHIRSPSDLRHQAVPIGGASALRTNDVCWATILGPEIVGRLGTARVAAARAFRVICVRESTYWIQLSARLSDCVLHPDRVEHARRDVLYDLGLLPEP